MAVALIRSARDSDAVDQLLYFGRVSGDEVWVTPDTYDERPSGFLFGEDDGFLSVTVLQRDACRRPTG